MRELIIGLVLSLISLVSFGQQSIYYADVNGDTMSVNFGGKDIYDLNPTSVRNGDFVDGDTDWAVGGVDSYISNGEARIYSPTGSSEFIRQSDVMTVDKVYIISYDVIATNGVDLANISTNIIWPTSTVGYKTKIFTAEYDYLFMKRISLDSETDVTLDNIRIEEVPTSMEFQSIQSATLDQVDITFKMFSSTDTAYVDFGDGIVQKAYGIVDKTYTSVYTVADTTYDIKIYGNGFNGTKGFKLQNEPTVSNLSIDDLPHLLTSLQIVGLSNTVGTLSKLSADLTFIYIKGAGIDISSGTFPAWAETNIYLYDGVYSSTQIDYFFINYNKTAGYGIKTLKTTGNNAPTDLSLAARTDLTDNKGKIVTTD